MAQTINGMHSTCGVAKCPDLRCSNCRDSQRMLTFRRSLRRFILPGGEAQILLEPLILKVISML